MTVSEKQTTPTLLDTLYRVIIRPHIGIEDVGERQRAQTISYLLLVTFMMTVVGWIVRINVTGPALIAKPYQLAVASASVFTFFGYLISRTKAYLLGFLLGLFGLSVAVFGAVILRPDHSEFEVLDTSIWLLLSIVVGGLVIPWWGALLWGLLNIAPLIIVPRVVESIDPDGFSTVLYLTVVLTFLLIALNRSRDREERARQVQMNVVNEQLLELSQSLEQRVEQATHSLELTVRVGQRISRLRDLDTVLFESMEDIHATYNLYYAQVYLLDKVGRTLELRAGRGEIGQKLVIQGHHLLVDMDSLYGMAVINRKTVIVEDTHTSIIYKPNPMLPETRSEMAIPLVAGDRILGVLDLHSRLVGELSADNLSTFEILASQLAVTIVNADLFGQVERSQSTLEKQARRLSLEGWQEMMDAIHAPERLGYVFDRQEVLPLVEPRTQKTDEKTIFAPIEILGQRVGAFSLESESEWSRDDKEVLVAVSNQLAQQIENLRLLSRSERYRQEAQEAVRRLTREGWDAIQNQIASGYVYDGQEVSSLSNYDGGDVQSDESEHTYDINVRGESIGQFSVSGLENLSNQDQAMVTEINQLLGSHLETLRLQQQTEIALGETEELYQASDAIIKSQDVDEVLRDVIERSPLNRFERASILLFNQPWETEPPEQGIVMGSWAEVGDPMMPHGTVFPVAQLPFVPFVKPDGPTIIKDIHNDHRIDKETHATISDFGRSMAFFPLVVARQWIGFVIVVGSKPISLNQNELRRIESLIDQAATVIQTQRLYEQTQAALERTDILYGISQALNEATSDEEIVQAILSPIVPTGATSIQLIHLEMDDEGYPTWAEIAASWRSEGEAVVTVGSRYYVPDLPYAKLWLADSEAPLFVSDFRKDERLDELTRELMEFGGTRSICVVPLSQAGERVGLLVFNWRNSHEFTRYEREIFNSLIDLVSPSVQSRRIYDQIQIQADQEALINRITQQIQGTSTVDDALQVAIRELGRALNAKWTSVHLG